MIDPIALSPTLSRNETLFPSLIGLVPGSGFIMPRYYFDFKDGETDALDEIGLVFENQKEARTAAIKLLPDVAHEELPDGDQHVFSVRIRDETGRYIFFATLSLFAQDLA